MILAPLRTGSHWPILIREMPKCPFIIRLINNNQNKTAIVLHCLDGPIISSLLVRLRTFTDTLTIKCYLLHSAWVLTGSFGPMAVWWNSKTRQHHMMGFVYSIDPSIFASLLLSRSIFSCFFFANIDSGMIHIHHKNYKTKDKLFYTWPKLQLTTYDYSTLRPHPLHLGFFLVKDTRTLNMSTSFCCTIVVFLGHQISFLHSR